MSYPEVDFLYLNEEDMVAAGVKDMAGCIDAMEEMFKLMKVGDYRMGGANGNSHGHVPAVLSVSGNAGRRSGQTFYGNASVSGRCVRHGRHEVVRLQLCQ